MTYYGYVRVHYPLTEGELVLRTEQDWGRDQLPVNVQEHEGCLRADFLVAHERPYLLLKPVLRGITNPPPPKLSKGVHWARGTNKLVILSEKPQDIYPHFFSAGQGRISKVRALESSSLGRSLSYRVYVPPGYDENYRKRYPVLYMHDGKNLFFPEEAFGGQEWQIDETLTLLESMSLIDRMIVVGIHAEESRNDDYTLPGYQSYGEALVNELRPSIARELRVLEGPRHTAVMGSSLGGVVSFFLAWQYPEVFGNAACLSSTFGWRDDLIERVRSEELGARKDLKIYLDSGWPRDNYEATLSMANALVERGFQVGRDLIHLAFPLHRHTESAWATRAPLPLQLFSGRLRRAAERFHRAHPTAPEAARCD